MIRPKNGQQVPHWLAALTLLGACLFPGSAQAEPAAVVLYGDSLTASYGLDPSQGYPALIQQKIDAADMGGQFQVIASAVSGETSAGGQRRLKWAMAGIDRKNQEIAVFMLALGANDGLRGQSVEAMRENLQGIITAVKKHSPDAQLIVAGMLMPPNFGEDYCKAYAAAFTEIAQDNGATLIPFLLKGVAGNPKLNLPDGIHPNAEGQQIIANQLWPVIEPILKQRQERQP